MTTGTITCDTLDERLPDYLESELSPAPRAEVDAHLATCARCSALVHDLGEIRVSAARLPVLAPSRDLWDGIAARIEAPVVPIPTARPARRTRSDWWRAGAAAAALMIATAGITYVATARHFQGGRGASSGASVVAVADTERALAPVAVSRPDTAARQAPASHAVPAMPAAIDSSDTGDAPRPRLDPDRSQGSGVTAVAGPGQRPTQRLLDAEIVRLQSIVTQRRADLDPKTVAIIEHSLRVIDEAIGQSRAALASDPASRFLNERLNSALDRKVELLRTVALLPARS